MYRKPLYFVAGIFSLSLASTVQYTEVFFIDFTQTPETIQVLVSICFVMIYVLCMIAIGYETGDEF